MATIMLPAEVDWVLDLLGFQWPNVHEDKMIEAAEAWSAFATAVRQYESQGTTAANGVHSANSGEAVEAFDDAWKKFAGDGYLGDAAAAAEVLAVVLSVVAGIVMAMKIAVIVQLIALAVEFAAAQAAAPVTLGASEAGAAAATATTRVIVRQLINEAKQKIVQAITEAIEKKVVRSAKEMVLELAKSIGTDVLKGVGQNIATQGIKSHFGAQQGFDFESAVKAGAKPVVEFEDDGWEPKGVGEKLKDIGKVGTGAYHTAQGVGQVAQGDIAGGAQKIYEGQQEQFAGAQEVAGIATKDKTPASEGGEGGGESGSSGASGGSSGGSSESSGAESSSSSGSGSGGGASARAAAPTPPPAPTTESGQAEADRARNAFG